MYQSITLILFLLCFSAKAHFLEDFVGQVTDVKVNQEIFQSNTFWKEQTKPSFWNVLATLKIEENSFCLMYRRLPARGIRKESLMLVKKKGATACLEEIEHPLWVAKDIDQTKIEWDKAELYLSFLKQKQFQIFRLRWLSQMFQSIGLTFQGSFKPNRQVDFTSPCLQLDKTCKEITPSFCQSCPNGVIGQYDEKSCAGQTLYCRRDLSCGVSEREACQVARETSTGCEERKEAYFCQPSLNMVCEQGRMVCY